MNHDQHERKGKRGVRLALFLLAMVLLSLSVGGVSAYLSLSSGTQTNTLTPVNHPVVSVTDTNGSVPIVVTITIPEIEGYPTDYTVYLRVAVDANWQDDNGILPGEPEFEFGIGDKWAYYDNFYYYLLPISTSEAFDVELPISVKSSAKDGCHVKINVAAQVIQAKGKTDDGLMSAVKAAWGVDPKELKSN